MSEGFTVFIVDDDPGVLKALSRLLRAADYETRIFASPRAFLASHDPSLPGCAVFDVAMPDVDGLALQRALAAAGVVRPIIFISGKGDYAFQAAVLVATFGLVVGCTDTLYALAATRAAHLLKGPRTALWSKRLGGGALIAAGVATAAAQK